MDTNYAAPGDPTVGNRDAELSRRGGGRESWGLRAAFVLALLVQVYLLYGRAPATPSGLEIPHLDKVAHVGMFALPALLGVLAGLRPWLVGLLLLVHAPVSEVIQHTFLPDRAGDPADLVADVIGIGLGLAVGLWMLRRSRAGVRSRSPG